MPGTRVTAAGVLALVAFIAAWVGTWNDWWADARVTWFLVALSMILALIGFGLARTSKWYGAILDSRNKASLAATQFAAWTVIALSAWGAIAMVRLAPGGLADLNPDEQDACLAALEPDSDPETCEADPLRIAFPEQLLLALGLSTAGFAGSGLIKSTKRTTTPNQAWLASQNIAAVRHAQSLRDRSDQLGGQWRESQQLLQDASIAYLRAFAGRGAEGESEFQQNLDRRLGGRVRALQTDAAAAARAAAAAEDVAVAGELKLERYRDGSYGLMAWNLSPKDATLRDLVSGDEIGNEEQTDVSKVQLLYVTGVILAAYGVAISSLLADSATLMDPLGIDLPAFTSSLTALLGISQGGYLAGKAVNHTPTEQ